MSDGKITYKVVVDDSDVSKDLDQVNQKVGAESAKAGGKVGEAFSGAMTDKFGAGAKKMEGMASTMGVNMSAGAMIGVAAIGAIGASAINIAGDMDKAMGDFVAATGVGIEETEKYQNVLEDIYANNYGEDFEDIAGSMAMVTQQMGEMSDEELQKIVESGYLMQDTFDIDMSESIRGANALIKDFGLEGEEAFNLIAQGAQNGLNQNQDLADQLAEYSGYYADMGFSAEEMFNMMKNGAEDGVFQIDYLNDAIKEFGIRSKDGSNASSKAFEDLGLDAKDMTKKFAEGGEGAREAFGKVVEELKSMDDQVLQNEIGVALFGTKFEDLGVDAVMALTKTEGAIDSANDKLEDMANVKYDNLGDMFNALKRSVEMLILPIGEALIPVILDLIKALLPIFQEVLPPIIDAFSLLLDPLMELVGSILPPLIGLFVSLMGPLMALFQSVLPPIIEIFKAFIEEGIMPLIGIIQAVLIPVIEALLDVFTIIFTDIGTIVSDTIGAIMGVMGGIIDFIKNVFTGNWKEAWDGVGRIFEGIFGGLKGVFKNSINGIIDGINSFTSKLGTIKVPDWVPDWLGGGRSIGFPQIPRLKVGMDYVPSDEFPAMLHRGEAVLPEEEANIYRSLGGNLRNMSMGMGAQESLTKVIHSGLIRVEGVNDQGQLVAIVEKEISNKIMQGDRRIANRAKIIPID